MIACMKRGREDKTFNSTDSLSSREALWTFLSSSGEILSGPAARVEERERARRRRRDVVMLEPRNPVTDHGPVVLLDINPTWSELCKGLAEGLRHQNNLRNCYNIQTSQGNDTFTNWRIFLFLYFWRDPARSTQFLVWWILLQNVGSQVLIFQLVLSGLQISIEN